MGKIYEKQQELNALTQQLSLFGNVAEEHVVEEHLAEEYVVEEHLADEHVVEEHLAEEDVPEEYMSQQDNLRQAELSQALPSSPPLTTISDLVKVPSLELVVNKSNFTRKMISVEKKLHLVDNDYAIAASISGGNSVNDRNKSSRVLSWSNGRKYDPTTGKIFKIRAELRICDRSMRELSGKTGLALDNVRDYIKEMDRQGFFTNT
jgi:hypothetical protein